MTGKKHILFAVSLSCNSLNPIVVGGAIIGSVLPDIDSRKSIISHYIPFQELTNGIFMDHRGGVHSLFACTLVSFVTGHFFGSAFGLGVFIGYLSHIVSDMLYYRGVAFLYPFTRERCKLFNLPKELADGIISLTMIICLGLWLYRTGWY